MSEHSAKDENNDDWSKEEPIDNITCSSSDCENDLHCFRNKRPRLGSYRNETCVVCGVELIDWTRLDKRNLQDVEYTFKSLKYEMVRHHYWHKKIDEGALRQAEKYGFDGLKEWTPNRLLHSVGPASDDIFRDGMQTPKVGNIVYYGQHATASCCRKCMEEWHGIPRSRPLTEKEIAYFTQLILLFVRDRMPNLAESAKKFGRQAKSSFRQE